MVYVILADGFEDIEALGTTDILRRCGLQVQTLSITGKRVVTSAHDLVVKADSLFRKNHLDYCDALVLPGGSKGAETLLGNGILRLTLQHQFAKGALIAAICAAPMVLDAAGILKGKHATIYPTMRTYLSDAIYHDNAYVVEHDNVITGSGPAATPHFAFAIAKRLVKTPAAVDEVARQMGYSPGSDNFANYLKF